jgi:hypothetical protein
LPVAASADRWAWILQAEERLTGSELNWALLVAQATAEMLHVSGCNVNTGAQIRTRVDRETTQMYLDLLRDWEPDFVRRIVAGLPSASLDITKQSTCGIT